MERHSTGELVELVHHALGVLACRAAPDSAAECLELAERLGASLDLGEAALARLVAAADRAGQPSALRYPGTRGWLKTALGMRTGRACERLTVARHLERLPEVAALFRAGKLSFGYVSTIVDAVAHLDDEDCAKAEPILLGLVEQGVSAAKVARAGARIKAIIAERDGTETPPEDAGRKDRSWWQVARSLGGGGFSRGWFAPQLMALIQERLGPLTRPQGPDDHRDHAQRMADALEMLLSGGSANWNATLVVRLDAADAGGQQAPGSDVPGQEAPGSGVPGQGAPGSGVPGQQAPGSGVPGQQAPGSGVPGQDVRGQDVRGPSVSHQGTPDPSTSAQDGFEDGFAQDAAGRDVSGPDAPAEGAPAQDALGRDAPDPHAPDPDMADPHAPDPDMAGPGDPGSVDAGLGDPGSVDAGLGGEGRRVPNWPLQNAQVVARLADGTPIPPERARVIALNAGVSLLLLGADGVPLYLGRRTRFVTSGQRLALEALYETCAFAECDIPARFCEADHVLNWADGGTTDIDMLAPCCGWHNRLKYERPDWVTRARESDGRWRYTLHRPARAP